MLAENVVEKKENVKWFFEIFTPDTNSSPREEIKIPFLYFSL
jgi:hypothetical protein